MLQIRPNCEQCDCELPFDSTIAMICSYECTFCRSCVKEILKNVCPNCGGAFVNRPIRPKNDWVKGVSINDQPASAQRVLKPIDPKAHQQWASQIMLIKPDAR